jgi:SAM-dependent methyltransferase
VTALETPPQQATTLEAYRAYVARAYRDEFGVTDAVQADSVAADWYHADARHDERFLELGGRMPGGLRVLDLASGMGTAVLRGLDLGLDIYGIEPDATKLGLMGRRIAEDPQQTKRTSRFARAVGEHLPYRDETFDAVLSYQTLEHVQNVDAVLAEMLRVIKPGGALHLRCPDYRGTFEGHYLLPWLPLMPRHLAQTYLRLCRRPAQGLRGIVYTTQRGITRSLKTSAARAGYSVEVMDLERERLRERLRVQGLPAHDFMISAVQAVQYVRKLFRAETQINLWVTRL